MQTLHSHFFLSFWAVLMCYEKVSQTKKNDTFRLECKIATLELEIQLLCSNSALAVQVVVTPGMNQRKVVEVNLLEVNFGKTLLGSINYLISKRFALNFLSETSFIPS